MNQYLELPGSITELFKGELMPHQVEGVRFMLNREKECIEDEDSDIRGGILCDEPGLGKTIQTIATIVGSPYKGTTLIITPVCVIEQFESELRTFAPHLSVVVLHGKRKKSSLKLITNNLSEIDVIITSFGLMTSSSKSENSIYNEISQITFTRIILDEGHCIRNKNNLHRSVLNLRSDIKFILTGTPIHNSASDGRNILKVLGITKYTGSKETLKLYFEKYMLRRKKDILPVKLNEPIIQIVPVEMKGKERELYIHQYNQTVHQMNAFPFINNNHFCILNYLIRMRQVSIHPQILETYYKKKYKQDEIESEIKEQSKFDTMFDMIEKHPQDKSIIFCHFTQEIDMISEQLENRGYNVSVFDGRCNKTEVLNRCRDIDYKRSIQEISYINRNKGLSLPVDIQMKIYEQVQTDILITQINAGSVGLNLQRFNRIYFTSPHYNPAIESQAIARCHRIGQKKQVYVTKLISVLPESDDLFTFEKRVLDIQKNKRKIQAELLNDNSILTDEAGALTSDDIQYMLQGDVIPNIQNIQQHIQQVIMNNNP